LRLKPVISCPLTLMSDCRSLAWLPRCHE